MESGVIVYAFLLAGFITLCGVGLFIWINSRESTLDNKSYDRTFDPSKMVSKYKYTGGIEENYDPTAKLKRYARPSKEAEAKAAKMDQILEEGLEDIDPDDVDLPYEELSEKSSPEEIIDLEPEEHLELEGEKE
jgi:hypothetical protein